MTLETPAYDKLGYIAIDALDDILNALYEAEETLTIIAGDSESHEQAVTWAEEYLDKYSKE